MRPTSVLDPSNDKREKGEGTETGGKETVDRKMGKKKLGVFSRRVETAECDEGAVAQISVKRTKGSGRVTCR